MLEFGPVTDDHGRVHGSDDAADAAAGAWCSSPCCAGSRSAPSGSAPALPAVDSSGTVIRSPDPVPGEYIVTLRSRSPDVVAPTVAGLTDRHGGQVLDVYTEALQGYAVATTARQAEELAADPAVASVEQNGYVSASDITSPQSPTPSWGLDRVDQHGTAGDNLDPWNADGAGVTAYVIDSGINTSLADFGGRASVGFDGVTPSTGGQDCAGHGTHVAGTIGGATYGVAKKVSLVSVRVLDCTGKGSFDQVIVGVNWVTANVVKPAVANMSLGGAPVNGFGHRGGQLHRFGHHVLDRGRQPGRRRMHVEPGPLTERR